MRLILDWIILVISGPLFFWGLRWTGESLKDAVAMYLLIFVDLVYIAFMMLQITGVI